MEADYVIVGSGSAGSALAYRLGEAGRSVIVIEYGGSDWGPFIQMPAALSYPMNMPRYDWGFRTEPEPHLGGRSLATPRGKVLGGSSSINGMVYVRGHPQDFDHWADGRRRGLGLGRRRALLHPHGELARRRLRLARHATARCTSPAGARRNPLYHAFVEAGAQAGFELTYDYNGQKQEGFGAMEQTVWRGRRWSAANAYLRPALARRNTTVVSGLATRVLIADGRATGVEIDRGGTREIVTAHAEVILSASSINTPKLLMLSGIGPAGHLAEHGITPVADRPGVGANLQDHLELYIQMRSLKPITLYSQYNYPAMARIGAQWLLAKMGLGTSNQFESAAFVRSAAGVDYPDIQYHFLPLAVRYDGRAAVRGHGFQAHVGPMRSPSRGTVRLRSANPADAPGHPLQLHEPGAGLDRLPPLHPPDPRDLRPARLPPLRRGRDPAGARVADRRRTRRLRARARRECIPPLRNRAPRAPRRSAGGGGPAGARDRGGAPAGRRQLDVSPHHQRQPQRPLDHGRREGRRPRPRPRPPAALQPRPVGQPALAGQRPLRRGSRPRPSEDKKRLERRVSAS